MPDHLERPSNVQPGPSLRCSYYHRRFRDRGSPFAFFAYRIVLVQRLDVFTHSAAGSLSSTPIDDFSA